MSLIKKSIVCTGWNCIDRDTVVPHVQKMPGPKSLAFTKRSMKHAATTTLDEGFVWARNKPAIGPWCTDIDGNIILDFASHIASAPFGYNHPEIVRLMEHFPKADPDRFAGTDFLVAYDGDFPSVADLHEKVVQITKQFGFDMALFSNSGTEAVEHAIKICYNARHSEGYGVCFDGAFHGRTLGALSLNRSKAVQREYYPQIPNIVSFPFCACRGMCMCGWETRSRKGKIETRIHQWLDKDSGLVMPDEVSYIIIEPIQGEGGYNIPRREFIRSVYKEAQSRGIPVISDEIQAGLGRTGKWWACEHFGVKPDVITAAKGLRVGATISHHKMFPQEKGRISGTWTEGNALASAIGWKTIDLIQREKLLLNAERMGRYFLKRLRDLLRYASVIDVRGLGLMDAIEFDLKKTRDTVEQKCLKHGLIVVGAGYKSLRLLPPLNVTKREIDVAVAILGNVLKSR
ncbi:MAG TPA: aminotransferase class III-fold pyridoxal phosphate-dependent enzyme [Candidatus Nanoarchaeia archaeon]|nr:aminotransferase class III-fold pyridoxal phosphate-dependent enzyme [Candidatus Nanoarchaeia archaeon]